MTDSAPSTASPPPRHRRRLLALAALLLLPAGVAAWLLGTTSGLSALAGLAGAATGGRLNVSVAGGRVLGDWHLAAVDWRGEGGRVHVADLRLAWTPAALLSGRLAVERLAIDRLRFDTEPRPDEPPPALPDSLRLPLAVTVEQLGIGRVEYGEKLLAEGLSARLDSDGARHRIERLALRSRLIEASGEAEIGADRPFPLQARAALRGQVEGHPFTLEAVAGGSLAALAVSGRAGGSVAGDFSIDATPFSPQPFSRLQASLAGLDPSAWAPGAPAAALDLDVDLRPQSGKELAVGGDFSLRNRTPGRLDQKRLPMAALAGRLQWRGDTADFSDLRAELRGGRQPGGTLAGSGRLEGRTLTLDLAARGLDASALHASLRPTRLSGPLRLAADPETQKLDAELADRQITLAARLARRGSEVAIEEASLVAGPARLAVRGRLGLEEGLPFSAEGELQRFDPARFLARAPAGSINARFSGAGSLRPQPAVSLRFDLADSRFNGQPLAGRGEVDLAWPQVRKADVSLIAGDNRLSARGAFGRPGDRLDIAVDAPRLDPYGLEGELRGEVRLAGTPAAPFLETRLLARTFGVPDSFRLRDLALSATLGPRPADPLKIELDLGAAETPDNVLARAVSLRADGSRARHALTATARLDERHLSLAAAGGLVERAGPPLWQGQVNELSLTEGEAKPLVGLARPTALRVGAAEWALGPADLAGPQWTARLQAAALSGRLHAEASGRGQPFGEFSGRLDAGLDGAWSLARTAPWNARLDVTVDDLARLAPLIGDDIAMSGRIVGGIDLSGTPDRPLLAGRFSGERLGLALADTGLRLENGRLAARLADNRLKLETLVFDSPLRPPPRPLVLAAGAEVARLAARPGRLEASGELGLGALDRQSGSGFVDVRVERLGAFQQPDQWVVLSGDGRLRWEAAGEDGRERLEATGRLQADAGYWELARLGAPSLSGDVVVRAPGGQARPAARPPVDFDVAADLGPRFHFVGAGLESRLAGSVRLRASGRDLPRATGSIRTVGGEFDAYGQKLAITRGIVNFQGLVDEPALNVRAVRRGLPVEPGVEVTGTAKKPVVRLVSDPELPEAEKLSWLVLGHGSEQAGGGDASTLLTAANALLGGNSGGVVQQLQRQFGLDEFGIRRGSVGDTGGRQTTSRIAGGGGFDAASGTTAGQVVTVGKRLSSNMVLSYEQALGRTGNIVKLTVNLTRRLSLIGRTGSDNAVDLFYVFRFGR